jgi:exodeoxyribonuclease-3
LHCRDKALGYPLILEAVIMPPLPPVPMPMKIATWNVNSLKVRLQHLLTWLEANPVDVLCIQETKLTDDKFPLAEINAAGYQVVFAGQKTYNGVAILSKHPIEDVQKGNPHFEDEQQRLIAATIAGMRIICAYVVNGQEIGSDKFAYKMAWLEGAAIRSWPCWATTTSPRKRATCTIRANGKTTSTSPRRNARRCRNSWRSA